MTTASPSRRRSRRKTLIWAFLAMFLMPVFAAAGALAYRGGPTHWSQWDRTVVSQMPAASDASGGARSGDDRPHPRLEGRRGGA